MCILWFILYFPPFCTCSTLGHGLNSPWVDFTMLSFVICRLGFIVCTQYYVAYSSGVFSSCGSGLKITEFTCVFAKEKPIPMGIGIGPSPHTSHLSLRVQWKREVRRPGVKKKNNYGKTVCSFIHGEQYISRFGSIWSIPFMICMLLMLPVWVGWCYTSECVSAMRALI